MRIGVLAASGEDRGTAKDIKDTRNTKEEQGAGQ